MRRLDERKERREERRKRPSRPSLTTSTKTHLPAPLKVLRVPFHPLSLFLSTSNTPFLYRASVDALYRFLFSFPLFFFNQTTNESFEPEESAGYWFLNRRFIVVACRAAWVKVSPGLLAVASKLETISWDKCSRSDIEECEVWEIWEIEDRVFEAED